MITTAPGRRQVRGILWKEIRTAHSRSLLPLGGRMLTQEWLLAEDWFAWGFTAPEYDPDRFVGFHEKHILVIVDEASGVSPIIFDEGISSIMSSEGARLLMIGNPTNPAGEFAKAFKDDQVSKFSVSAFDTPNFTAFGITQEDIEDGSWQAKITGPLPRPYLVTPEWVAKRWDRWGRSRAAPNYMARVLGQFPDVSPDTLFPLHWIEAAQARDLKPRADDANELGVDVARFGGDSSSCYHRRGPRVRRVWSYQGLDTRQTTAHVIATRKRVEADRSKVDVIGVGAGVVDGLTEVSEPVVAVNVAEAAQDPDSFVNKRAEEYWTLRGLFERGEIDIDPADEELASELASMKFFYDSKGRILIESKADAKKRGVDSPDNADAVMLAFARVPQEDEKQARAKKLKAMSRWG